MQVPRRRHLSPQQVLTARPKVSNCSCYECFEVGKGESCFSRPGALLCYKFKEDDQQLEHPTEISCKACHETHSGCKACHRACHKACHEAHPNVHSFIQRCKGCRGSAGKDCCAGMLVHLTIFPASIIRLTFV